jgi:alpha-galactosidase/6-phospho-beta-glucosidase family protein
MSEENVINNEVAPEVVKEAESQGWVPKERFRGNESDWVDADTFVKRGREILPILRKNNENLVKDLQATKEQLKEFREAAEEFKKFQKEAYERKANEYEDRIREIKESRAQAISDGDGQKVNALDDALDQAKEDLKEAKQAVIEANKASTSYLQRKLRVGYSRAARLMDILEDKGVIGPADGAKPREILAGKEDQSTE